jgi:hypothetical protein
MVLEIGESGGLNYIIEVMIFGFESTFMIFFIVI